MKRMRRMLIHILAALSFVLLVATLIVWVGSHVAPEIDFFNVRHAGVSYGLGTERGAIIGYLQMEKPTYRAFDPADVQKVGGGFRYLRITSKGMRRWNLVIPFWMLAMIFLVPPAFWWRARQKARHRKRMGLCASCGYDLRATPERCPECGDVQERETL